MNVVFESFVARLFDEYYPLLNKAQKGKKAWETDTGKTSQIRTDILIYENDKVHSIIDTKYKKDITEADKFQIGFYIHEYNKNTGYAILPKHKDSSDYQLRFIEQGITINVNHINIDEMLELIYSDNLQKSYDLREKLKKLIPI